jgi:hypothetical protein
MLGKKEKDVEVLFSLPHPLKRRCFDCAKRKVAANALPALGNLGYRQNRNCNLLGPLGFLGSLGSCKIVLVRLC